MCNKFGDNLRNHLLTRRPPVANERVAEMQICERKNFARKFIANYFKLCWQPPLASQTARRTWILLNYENWQSMNFSICTITRLMKSICQGWQRINDDLSLMNKFVARLSACFNPRQLQKVNNSIYAFFHHSLKSKPILLFANATSET